MDKGSNRITSRQGLLEDNRIKELVSNKWAMANNNKTSKTNTNSMEPNNNSMDSSKITNSKIMVNLELNNNNQVIISVALIIIKIKTKIISEHNSSNSLGSTITIKIINSSSNSKDLIISNSNSPLSNKATKVRHLICFECPIDLFNLKGK